MGQAIKLMATLARSDLDDCEASVVRALSEIEASPQGIDWIPMVLFYGESLVYLRKLVRIAMGSEFARELSSNLAWEDDAGEKLAIRSAILGLSELCSPARFDGLWRLCLNEICHESLSSRNPKIDSLLRCGPGSGAVRRALIAALLEFHVPEDRMDLEEWAAGAYANHEKIVLSDASDDSSAATGGSARL